MIFRPELVRQIRAGRKTQTRRPIKPDQPCRYHPDKTYAVQPGRGQAAICRIHILHVEHQLAGDITLEDAIQEGFRTTDEFKAYWTTVHDMPWLAKQQKLAQDANADPDIEIDVDVFLALRALDRFRERHAHRPVWAITFQLDITPKPRFLAARSDELYVTNAAQALQGEPEAVTETEQRRITEVAGMTHAHWKAIEHANRNRERALLRIEERMRAARRAAAMSHLNLSGEFHVLRQMIDRASRGDTVDAPAATSRLEKIERRLDMAA